MRVITGTAGGIPLKAPEGLETRPTADRVKQALFNIIQFDIAGEVLDLFAGSGQLGIEALSRGASKATFVDAGKEAVSVIRANLKKTNFTGRSEVLQTDYMSFLDRCRKKYRLIFLDPPYAEKFLENAIKRISEIDILAEGGIIVAERPAGKPLNQDFCGLLRSKDYQYGKTIITLFRRERENV